MLGPTVWNPPTAPKQQATKRGRGLYGALALVVALAAGWWLYGTLTAEEVPESIAAYADGDIGETYSSPLVGYSVRLPGQPVEETVSAPLLGTTLRMDLAYHETADLVAGVMVVDLPPGSGLNPDLVLEGGVWGVEAYGGAEIKSQEDTTHQGHAAMDLAIDADGGNAKFRMVLVGDRAYVAFAAVPGAGADTAFDALVSSFVIGSTI